MKFINILWVLSSIPFFFIYLYIRNLSRTPIVLLFYRSYKEEDGNKYFTGFEPSTGKTYEDIKVDKKIENEGFFQKVYISPSKDFKKGKVIIQEDLYDKIYGDITFTGLFYVPIVFASLILGGFIISLNSLFSEIKKKLTSNSKRKFKGKSKVKGKSKSSKI